MSSKKRLIRLALGMAVLALLCLGTAWALLQNGRVDIAGDTTGASITVTSSSFKNGDAIPARFTCDGANVSPDIQWSTPPPGTKSIAIVMDDSDTPLLFTHWLVYDIPANAHDIPEGASTPSTRLGHAAEGVNNFGDIGYGGPCPPSGTHHYNFRVYALDVDLTLPPGQSKDQLADAVKGHVLAKGLITGAFTH
jgi:Raf kinase inhibitor-like YbhB/YbcL family protein